MFCQKCGIENPDTNRYCGSCGEDLNPPQNQKYKFSPNAGMVLLGIAIILSVFLIPVPEYGVPVIKAFERAPIIIYGILLFGISFVVVGTL